MTASTISARAYMDQNGYARAGMEVPADEIEYLSGRAGDAAHSMEQAEEPAPQPCGDDGFMDIPPDMEDDMPFN